MAEMMDDVIQLSENIGPRPAGTEEEQQAALYIADELQQSARFNTVIEDFNCASSANTATNVCFLTALIAALVPIFLPAAAIPCFVVGALACGLFIAELLNKPLLSRLFRRGVSQNVVAKYQPSGTAAQSRSRKIILVAGYDSGRTMMEYNSPLVSFMPLLQKAACVAIIAAPVILLLRTVLFLSVTGAVALIFNVLTGICALLLALPLLGSLSARMGGYNDAANNNAAGVAVLLGVARKVGNGMVSTEDMEENATQEGVRVHGKKAALEAGVLPEGVEVEYNTAQTPVREMTPAESLAAAKAAIAALTGQPVADKVPVTDISSKLVHYGEDASSESASMRFSVDEGAMPARSGSGVEGFLTGAAASAAAGVASAAGVAGAAAAAEAADEAVAAVTESDENIFVRNTPAALQKNVPVAEPVVQDNIPAWARAAKAKAHDNKPELNQQAVVSRSRFADTKAAQITDENIAASPNAASGFAAIISSANQARQAQQAVVEQASVETQEVVQKEVQQPAEPMSPLAARLAALRSEIEAAEAPTISKETQEVLDSMAPVEEQSAEPLVEQGFVSEPVIVSVADQQKTHHDEEVPADATAAIAPIDVSNLISRANEDEEEQSDSTAPVSLNEIQEALNEEPVAPVAPIVGMENLVPSVAMSSADDHVQQDAPERQVIVLPDVVSHATITEDFKQRAPMAEVNESSQLGAQALLSNMLPRIEDDFTPAPGYTPGSYFDDEYDNDDAFASNQPVDTFGLNVPSFDAHEPENTTVSATSSFSTLGATGAFAPVGDDLIADVDPDEIYVDDADDSAFEQEFTQTGAFAGPGYVEMPKSRVGGFFSRFRSKKNKQEAEPTVAQWVGADENYDARSVGKARGGWESFRNDDEDFFDDGFQDDFDTNPRGWNGGAFSLSRFRKKKDAEVEEPVENQQDAEEYFDEYDVDIVEPEAYFAKQEDEGDEHIRKINQELDRVDSFRYPGLDTEIWFVALGAEKAGNSGIRAFIEEHKSELKGAIFVNIEALGAGRLSFVESEGKYKPHSASARMKRYLRSATEKTGITFSTDSLLGRDTAATVAARAGYQAFTVAGMDKNKTAYYASRDDVVGNIDADLMAENSDFVMGILQSI